jgi:hypothetical protein
MEALYSFKHQPDSTASHPRKVTFRRLRFYTQCVDQKNMYGIKIKKLALFKYASISANYLHRVDTYFVIAKALLTYTDDEFIFELEDI